MIDIRKEVTEIDKTDLKPLDKIREFTGLFFRAINEAGQAGLRKHEMGILMLSIEQQATRQLLEDFNEKRTDN